MPRRLPTNPNTAGRRSHGFRAEQLSWLVLIYGVTLTGCFSPGAHVDPQDDAGLPADDAATPVTSSSDTRYDYKGQQLPMAAKLLRVSATSQQEDHPVDLLNDGDRTTSWRGTAGAATLHIDLDRPRRVVGLTVRADADGWGGVKAYRVLGSPDGVAAPQALTQGELAQRATAQTILLPEGGVVLRRIALEVLTHHGSGAAVAELSISTAAGFVSLPSRYVFAGQHANQDIVLDMPQVDVNAVRYTGMMPLAGQPGGVSHLPGPAGFSAIWTPDEKTAGTRRTWSLEARAGGQIVRSGDIKTDVFPTTEIASATVPFNSGGTLTVPADGASPFAGLTLAIGPPQKKASASATLNVQLMHVGVVEDKGTTHHITEHAPAPIDAAEAVFIVRLSAPTTTVPVSHTIEADLPLPSGDGAPPAAQTVVVAYGQPVHRSQLSGPLLALGDNKEAVPVLPQVSDGRVKFDVQRDVAYGLGRAGRLRKPLEHNGQEVGEVVLVTGPHGPSGDTVAAQSAMLKAIATAANEAVDKGLWCGLGQAPYRIVILPALDGQTQLPSTVRTEHALYVTEALVTDVDRAGRTLAGTLARELFQLHDLRAGNNDDDQTLRNFFEAPAGYAEFLVHPESPLLYGSNTRDFFSAAFLAKGPTRHQWPLIAHWHQRHGEWVCGRLPSRTDWSTYAESVLKGAFDEAHFGAGAEVMGQHLTYDTQASDFSGQPVERSSHLGGTQALWLRNATGEPQPVMVDSGKAWQFVLLDDSFTEIERVTAPRNTDFNGADLKQYRRSLVIAPGQSVWAIVHADIDHRVGEQTLRASRPMIQAGFQPRHQRVVPIAPGSYELREGQHPLQFFGKFANTAFQLSTPEGPTVCDWAWETDYPQFEPTPLGAFIHNLTGWVDLPWDCGPVQIEATAYTTGFHFKKRLQGVTDVTTQVPTWRAVLQDRNTDFSTVVHPTFETLDEATTYYAERPWPGAPATPNIVYVDLSAFQEAGDLTSAAGTLLDALCADATDINACKLAREDDVLTQIQTEGWGFLVARNGDESSALGFCKEQWRNRTVTVSTPTRPDSLAEPPFCKFEQVLGIDRACFSGEPTAPKWWIPDADWPLGNGPLGPSTCDSEGGS